MAHPAQVSEVPAPSMARLATVGVLGLLAASLIALAVAPLSLGEGYSVLRHTTSESAGQGVEHAWVARTGFVLFGLAVVPLVVFLRPYWGSPGAIVLAVFAGLHAGCRAVLQPLLG